MLVRPARLEQVVSKLHRVLVLIAIELHHHLHADDGSVSGRRKIVEALVLPGAVPLGLDVRVVVRLENDVRVAVGEAESVGAGVEERKNTSLQAIAEADSATVQQDLDALRGQLQPLRRQVSDPRMSDLFSKIDRQHEILWTADRKLSDASRRLGPLESEELTRIRARFDREVAEVDKQRQELESTLTEAQTVSEDLTRSGFGRLEDFFADSVLRADVGIVDVYWAQKVEVSDEKTRVIEERNALRDQISRRFELIEQKLRL